MARRPHLLIVDDDREIRSLLSRFLARHGFRIATAKNGSDSPWETRTFDLIILDLMLPGEDGLAICRRIRRDSRIPIIMLTALDTDTDRIIGLEVGADDYLAKPFNPRELLARIRAVLRRAEDAVMADDGQGGVYGFEGWSLDSGRRTLHDPEGEPVMLTAGEFDLLVALVRRADRVVSRDQLMDLLHGREAGPFDRSIDVQVSRLRSKIERSPSEPQLIKTVRGQGYVLAARVVRL